MTIIIHRSLLRALETNPVSFYMIYNLSYETKKRRVMKLLKAQAKNIFFSMGDSVNMRIHNILLVTEQA